jgi:hypothetical protein
MGRLTGKYAVAVKRLSAVETSAKVSNQHELNGSSALRLILGDQQRTDFPVRWLFLADESEPVEEAHDCSWYDARKNSPDRTEWRLYYRGQPPLSEGDLLVCLHREQGDELVFIVGRSGSTWEAQLVALFGPPDTNAGSFAIGKFEQIPAEYVAIADQLFELLGWIEKTLELDPTDLELLIQKYGKKFPSTREFSAFARSRCQVDLRDPDAALLVWWQREEALFRGLEEIELSERLGRQPPFTGVEDFMSYSLSVQNRRKSRAGHALENHVEELLRLRGLRFTRGARTEGDRRPDFLLPGDREYRDAGFPTALLTMLAAKTTCKDRWRQVLSEAARVPKKHLLTLEPAISATQLSEMHQEGLSLVVVRKLLPTYTPPPGMTLVTVGEFLGAAEGRQQQFPY